MTTPKGFYRCIGINCPACPAPRAGLTPGGWGPTFHPLNSAPVGYGIMYMNGDVFMIEPDPADVAPALVA